VDTPALCAQAASLVSNGHPQSRVGRAAVAPAILHCPHDDHQPPRLKTLALPVACAPRSPALAVT